MSNSTHEFKAGDKAIVLPNSRQLWLTPFDIVVKTNAYSEACKLFWWEDLEGNNVGLFDNEEMELQPLPIPYHLLDAE